MSSKLSEDELAVSDSDENRFADLENEVDELASFSEPEELQQTFELPVQTLL